MNKNKPYDAAKAYNEFQWKQSAVQGKIDQYKKTMPLVEAIKQALKDVGEY